MDYRLALMAGTDIPIPECQITLHQPSIKEIAFIGEKDFFTGLQCLCIDKELCFQDSFLLANTTNFQVFMTVMNEKEIVDKKQAVLAVLTVLFPNYKVLFTPRALVFSSDQGSPMIDESNFQALQDILAMVFCLHRSDQGKFNPANDAAKKIADKLKRGRQRVAQQKASENEGASMFVQYLSILTVGLNSMSLQDCINLTMYQMYDLVERYTLYVNWDIDMRSRLAGAKPDKPVDNWMKNIH